MASASVYLNESPTGHCLASVGKGAPNHDGSNSDGRGWGCAWGCARVCACVRPCMRACVMCLQYTVIIFYPG